MGADIDDVATIQGDSAITPYGAGTQGSRSGPMTAGAVKCDDLFPQNGSRLVTRMCQFHFGFGHLEVVRGLATVRGDPSKTVSFGELAYLAYYQPQQLPPGLSPVLEATARYVAKTPILWANAKRRTAPDDSRIISAAR